MQRESERLDTDARCFHVHIYAQRYSQREREIGRDSTLIAEREGERDWTLMPDVFMCIYMLVIGEGREGETETEV